MKLSLSLLFTGLIVVSASNVVDLYPENFDSEIGNGKPALVEFFAPWCGHCKNLAPTYEQLADAFAHAKDKVTVAKVDADGVGKSLGQKYGVTGFPTLKWFDENGNIEPFEGGRDLESLVNFITLKSGLKSNIKAPPPPETLILDAHSFDSIALDETKDVLVTFTAPWCGHCKNLKPIYEQVAIDFKTEKNCVVANLDADHQLNKDIAGRYEVNSYPTIKFFPRGGKEVVTYEGPRTEPAFVDFLNERCKTQRAVGGGLNDEAGRIAELDALAQKFLTVSGDARDFIYREALTLSGSLGEVANHYIRVMEKVVTDSESYVENEYKRLTSILNKRTMSHAKLDEMKMKANVLNAFFASKLEEVQEKVDSVIGRATAEL